MNLLNEKHILVTGGAGFIGSNLVRALVNNQRAKVTVLDDLFTGDLEHIKDVEHEFVRGSVEDKSIVNDCIRGKDIVFHLASRNIIISNSNPREDLAVNVGGSFNVFEASLNHKVKRVVYASTSSVYGNPQRLPVSENDAKNFLNFYSASKHSAEAYAKTFFEVFGLPVSIVRYSNVYGPAQSPSNPYCGVIGKFVNAALKGEPLQVHGSGRHTRDYTYIDDAVSATIMAAVAPKAIGQDYNIGTGKEISVNDLANMIIGFTNSSSKIVNISNRDIDNISRRYIDISKSRDHLQYQPQFNLYRGMENTVQWFHKAMSKTAVAMSLSMAFL